MAASTPLGGWRIPIISLYGNLIVSIQVSLTDRLVEQLKSDVGTRIEEQGAEGLIIDLSGVDLLDSYLSRAIRDVALIARLMGVPTVLCGMDPAMAITLVEMGMDMMGVDTALNLEAALEQLQAQQALA